MNSEAQGILRLCPLFSRLPQSGLDALAAASRLRDLAEGEALAGEGVSCVFVVVSGEVVIKAGGTASRLGPGESLGEDVVLGRQPAMASAFASLPSRVLEVPGAAVIDYLEAHFDVAIQLISVLATQLREQVREITDLKMQSTAERLAGFLVGLAGEVTGRAVVRLPCEKRQLADHLGMDPATLSRAFAKLRDKGVSASRSDKVEISDVGRLRNYGDCATLQA